MPACSHCSRHGRFRGHRGANPGREGLHHVGLTGCASKRLKAGCRSGRNEGPKPHRNMRLPEASMVTRLPDRLKPHCGHQGSPVRAVGGGWVGVQVGVGWGWGVGAAAGELALKNLWLRQSLQARLLRCLRPRHKDRLCRAAINRNHKDLPRNRPAVGAHTLGIQGMGSMPFYSQGRWYHNSTWSALQAILKTCVGFLCALQQESLILSIPLPGQPAYQPKYSQTR